MDNFSDRTDGEIAVTRLHTFGGHLECGTCGKLAALNDIKNWLDHGWPECCGSTMRWWTQREIDQRNDG